jgi:hypothetical protein
MSTINEGFDLKTINDYKSKMNDQGFMIVESEDNGDEYVNFLFVGNYKGKEVIYDAVIYTLRLNHHSELYEIAEQRTTDKYPEFNSMTYSVDENGDLNKLSEKEEEVGLYMTELILELEDEGEVKVKEHVDVDTSLDFGVGLDIGLNVEEVSSNVIADFVKKYNEDTLELDKTLYAFETEGIEDV